MHGQHNVSSAAGWLAGLLAIQQRDAPTVALVAGVLASVTSCRGSLLNGSGDEEGWGGVGGWKGKEEEERRDCSGGGGDCAAASAVIHHGNCNPLARNNACWTDGRLDSANGQRRLSTTDRRASTSTSFLADQSVAQRRRRSKNLLVYTYKGALSV